MLAHDVLQCFFTVKTKEQKQCRSTVYIRLLSKGIIVLIAMTMLTKPVIISCLLGGVAAFWDAVVPREEEDSCTPAVTVECSEIHKPVHVQTYIEENTVINIPGCPRLEVRNAPTLLNTVLIATSTVISPR